MLEFMPIQNLSDMQFIHRSIKEELLGAFYKATGLNTSKIKYHEQIKEGKGNFGSKKIEWNTIVKCDVINLDWILGQILKKAVAHAYSPSALGGPGGRIAWGREFETRLSNKARPLLYKIFLKISLSPGVRCYSELWWCHYIPGWKSQTPSLKNLKNKI